MLLFLNTDNAVRDRMNVLNEGFEVENPSIRTTGGTWNKCMLHDFAESNALYFLFLVMFSLATYGT